MFDVRLSFMRALGLVVFCRIHLTAVFILADRVDQADVGFLSIVFTQSLGFRRLLVEQKSP